MVIITIQRLGFNYKFNPFLKWERIVSYREALSYKIIWIFEVAFEKSL